MEIGKKTEKIGYILARYEGESWLDAAMRLGNNTNIAEAVKHMYELNINKNKYSEEKAAWYACLDYGILERIEIEKIVRDSIPIILFCPLCKQRHIDEGEFADKPHHTHACQICGNVWRPAIVNTVGVQFLPGFKNGDLKNNFDNIIQCYKCSTPILFTGDGKSIPCYNCAEK